MTSSPFGFVDIQTQPSRPTQRAHDRAIGETAAIIECGQPVDDAVVRRAINEGRGNGRRATDTMPRAPATRSPSLDSSGGTTGLLTAADTPA